MSYELYIIPETQIVFFRWTGPFTHEDHKKSMDRVKKFSLENNVFNLMVDSRKQINEISTAELIDFALTLPEVMKQTYRLAIVMRPDEEEGSFVESVNANRGSSIHAFTNIKNARAWLESLDE